jgi:PAS domain S-box-containing protein
MRLTLRTKLMAIVGVAAFAFLLIIVVGAVTEQRADRQLATIQDRYVPKIELELQLDGTFEKLRRGFQDAVAAHDADALATTTAVKTHFLDQLAAANAAVEPAAAAELRIALEDYYASAYDLSRRLIADETGESVVDAMRGMQEKQGRFAEVLKRTTAFDRRELAHSFESVNEATAEASSYRRWISVGCLAAVMLLSMWLGRGVLRSLGSLTSGFKRFGEGDFAHVIRVASHDELGDVAQHANQMAVSLERLGKETKRAEEKFRALMESAPDAMVIVDAERNIVLVNAQTEKLFGHARADLLGEPLVRLTPEAAGSDPSAPRLELFGRRKDGTEFPVEITSSPLDTEEGALVSHAIRDITERKRIENDLMLSNRELEAFSYAVAHDLRAPLRGINGFSRALLEDNHDKLDDESKDYLNRIAGGAERMGELIDALLGLSRVTRVEIRREAVNLSRMADGVIRQLRATHPERVVEFANQEDVIANGDPALLRALFENLLGNAWKFTATREGARIAFGSVQKDGAPVYSIQDNGAGFDMAHADKLFAPFQRLHKASEFAGTGIGLATVQRIVRRHSGEIWADGSVGRGATFHFTLASSIEGISS